MPHPSILTRLVLTSALLVASPWWEGCADAPPLDEPTSPTLAELRSTEEARTTQLTSHPAAQSWTRRVLYFALLDRFANGDVDNDQSHGEQVCNNPDDAHAYQGGDLAGLQERLGYIRDLGADALWVSPLYRGVATKQGANCGFPGYWVDFADPYELELDPRFGSAALFDQVLDDAHGLGLSVMLDMVINHAGYGATITEQHPQWFTDPATCWQQGDPDIYCALAGLPDFDHRVPEARAYLEDVHRMWVERFAIDGIRMDTVKHVEPDTFASWTSAMREERPELYLVGELLDEHSFDRFDRYLDAGFDGLFNFPLRRGFIDTFARGQSVDVVASRMQETLARFGADRTAQLVNLLDNHDVPRFLEEMPAGVSGAEAQERYHLALTALLTLPGVPQLYYGNEIGMYGGHDPDNRRFMPSWAFSQSGRQNTYAGFLPSPNRVHEHVKRVLTIRRNTPALQDGVYRELWRQNGPANNNVWAYARQRGESIAIVAFNNGYLATDGAVPVQVGDLLDDGTGMIDAIGTANVAIFVVEDGTLRLQLPPRSSVILVREDAPHPVDDLVEVSFEVFADTHRGQNVFLTGGTIELAHWDLARARQLSPAGCTGQRCSWTTTLSLPDDQLIEYKFVKIDENLQVEWESGFNRALQVSPGQHVVAGDFRSD